MPAEKRLATAEAEVRYADATRMRSGDYLRQDPNGFVHGRQTE